MNNHKSIDRLDQLIKKGEAVLSTHRPNPPNIIGFSTLEAGVFNEWRTQSLSCLTSIVGQEHTYIVNFDKRVREGKLSQVKSGIGILMAVREDLTNGLLDHPSPADAIFIVEQMCSRFHLAARQLRARHENRETLNVQDEYDVQDLMHALLHIYFEDIRSEEYTPSYAGKSTRMDFLLKREAVVIEVKKTRPSLGPKELSAQLIEDIQRYKSHPDCQTLICFVYDPDGYIPNPRGIESDLKRDGDPFPVRVLIRPK
jgi:hypothetical protein